MELDWGFALGALPLIVVSSFAYVWGDRWRDTESRAVSIVGWVLYVIGIVGIAILGLMIILNFFGPIIYGIASLFL
jgi:hypothetical protein